MAYEIIVKKRFTNKLLKLLSYLEMEWGGAVAEKFSIKLERRLDTLLEQPLIGAESDILNVRSILITKHNRLYYRIKGTTIE